MLACVLCRCHGPQQSRAQDFKISILQKHYRYKYQYLAANVSHTHIHSTSRMAAYPGNGIHLSCTVKVRLLNTCRIIRLVHIKSTIHIASNGLRPPWGSCHSWTVPCCLCLFQVQHPFAQNTEAAGVLGVVCFYSLASAQLLTWAAYSSDCLERTKALCGCTVKLHPRGSSP